MDFDGQFRFTVLNDLNIDTPPTEGVQAQDARTTRYRMQTESGELIISTSAQECTDTMSGERFSTERNTIRFKQLFATKMFCPTPEGTPDIGALLAGKTLDFEFGNNRLYLKKDNQIILTLKP